MAGTNPRLPQAWMTTALKWWGTVSASGRRLHNQPLPCRARSSYQVATVERSRLRSLRRPHPSILWTADAGGHQGGIESSAGGDAAAHQVNRMNLLLRCW